MQTESTPIPANDSTPITALDHAVMEGDQSAFKDARRAERAGKPLDAPKKDVVAPKADEPVSDTPEQEALSTKPDADVSEAARTLRKNRAEERKAKIQREIDDLTATKYREQEELARLRREREELSRGEQPRHATADATSSADDPEPKEEDFATIGEYIAARVSWGVRHGLRQVDTQSRERHARQASERALQTRAAKLDEHQAAGRAKYADFDVVVESVLAPLRGTPRATAVAEFLEGSDVAADVIYRIGKDPETIKRIAEAATPSALIRALTHVESDILAPKVAPKPVTSAPPPPTTLGTKAVEPADELEAAVASGDQSQFKAIRLRQRAAGLR